MLKKIKGAWDAVMALGRTDVRVFVDLAAGRWIERRGYLVVREDQHEALTSQLAGLYDYVERSGHLSTVSGRKPRAVDRIRRSCARAFALATPVRVRLHAER